MTKMHMCVFEYEQDAQYADNIIYVEDIMN